MCKKNKKTDIQVDTEPPLMMDCVKCDAVPGVLVSTDRKHH